jgi:uncharacterized phage protein gp47/JayE
VTDLLDIIPLTTRLEDDIRADFDVVANLGKNPDDPTWIDTREGSMFFICTQPSVVQLARVYDLVASELIAAMNVATAWGDYLDLHAQSYNLERKAATKATGVQRFTGTQGTLIAVGAEIGPAQSDPDVEPPTFVTTESDIIPAGGFIDLAIEAVDPGSEGNIAANAITLLISAVSGTVSSITNPSATVGGADTESDEALRERIQLAFAGTGSGNITWYKRYALGFEGVGRVQVVPHFNGPGTVMVIIADVNGGPLPTSKINEVQLALDPVPGQGEGDAPIDHAVTVATPVAVNIDIAATITFVHGYSLDGDNGTTALRDAINASLADYIDSLAPGDDVIYENVKAQFFEVDGVLDIGAVTVEGGTANVAIAANPPQVAQLATTTFTQVLT